MKKTIGLIMAGLITMSGITAMSSSAVAFIQTTDSELYKNKIEYLNNYYIPSPEYTEILPTILHADENGLLDGKMVNVWTGTKSTANFSAFYYEIKHSDRFSYEFDLPEDEDNTDEIINDLKNKLGYSDKVNVESSLHNNRLSISVSCNYDNHDLNRMIFEKGHVILSEKYGKISYYVGINKRSFQEVLVHNGIYLFDGETIDKIDYDSVDHDMLMEKYGAVYDDEKQAVVLPEDSTVTEQLECLYYFTSEFDAWCGREFIFSAYEFSSEIDVENTEYCYGDANLDGRTTVADAVAILQSIGNRDKYPLSAQGKFNGDVDGEDGITANDALTLQIWDAKGEL